MIYDKWFVKGLNWGACYDKVEKTRKGTYIPSMTTYLLTSVLVQDAGDFVKDIIECVMQILETDKRRFYLKIFPESSSWRNRDTDKEQIVVIIKSSW